MYAKPIVVSLADVVAMMTGSHHKSLFVFPYSSGISNHVDLFKYQLARHHFKSNLNVLKFES